MDVSGKITVSISTSPRLHADAELSSRALKRLIVLRSHVTLRTAVTIAVTPADQAARNRVKSTAHPIRVPACSLPGRICVFVRPNSELRGLATKVASTQLNAAVDRDALSLSTHASVPDRELVDHLTTNRRRGIRETTRVPLQFRAKTAARAVANAAAFAAARGCQPASSAADLLSSA